MLINKLLKNLYTGAALLCVVWFLSGCEKGLTFEEAPESTYSQVEASRFDVKARELFENQIYAVNWDKWVENYINTQTIGASNGSWKNGTGAAVTLSNGEVVQPGATVSGSIKEENNAEAPGGKLYVITAYVNDHAKYKTANKGYLFDGSKFTGDFTLANPTNNRSEYVTLPVRKNEIIGELVLVNPYDCIVEPVKGAAELGKPGDFSQPQRYLVKNIAYRPAGVPQYTRLYEVRIVFYPG
ncbi:MULTISPECIES: hypothetical protein [Proteiniphilum]|jgi:hypothetical protein|nr:MULTISPECIES: hypothetical protein [Proteiniphilum]